MLFTMNRQLSDTTKRACYYLMIAVLIVVYISLICFADLDQLVMKFLF
ncbi:hypothetical protein VME0621_03660 [Vibrio mediterranei]|nr:hypothetical protein VME0621_03660 [Vibrio mediterranei]